MFDLNKILLYLHPLKTEIVAQLVRAPDCGSGGRGFETRLSPKVLKVDENRPFFLSFFVHFRIKFLATMKLNLTVGI